MSIDPLCQTRIAYGDSADRFAASVGTTISPRFEAPVDIAMLQTVVDLARHDSLPVLNAGCATGRVARMMADAGLDVLGIDAAVGMVDEARLAHPDLAFITGELADLPVTSRSFGAIVSWYSIITTPPDGLHDIWAELRRVLAPGGCVLVAFQSGAGESRRHRNAFGTSADLTLFHHDASIVRTGLEEMAMTIHTVARRRRHFDHETTDHVFILATDAQHTGAQP